MIGQGSKNGRTKLARCLVMHSSYNSGDHGENLRFIFETRSEDVRWRYGTADVSVEIRAAGSVDLRETCTLLALLVRRSG